MTNSAYHIFNNSKEMQFEISLEGSKASLTYRFYKNDIVFMHTLVPPELEGRGIAAALAVEAFKYAEAENKLVMVYCPYVAEFIKKHPEYVRQLDPEHYE